jgi:hypothetical protein
MPQLNAAQAIVKPDGTMEPVFRDQMNRYEAQYPLSGSGSPEGVVEGSYLQLYINTTGVSGSIEYRKLLPDIGGNKKLGWVAV